MTRLRTGATLVECMVATVLLGAGVLAVSGAGVAAMRVLATAEQEQLATEHAAATIDSLTVLERPTSGSTQDGAFRIDWSSRSIAAGTEITVAVTGPDGRTLLALAGHAAPWPPRIARVP